MTKEAPRQNSTSQGEPAAPAGLTASNANANTAGLADQNTDAVPTEAPAAVVQPSAPKGHGGAEAPHPVEVAAGRDEASPSAAPPPPAPATVATEGTAEVSRPAPKAAPAEEGEAARADNKDKSENRDKSARSSDADDALSNDAAAQRRAQSRNVTEVQMPDGGTRNQKQRAADNNVTGNYGVGNAGTAAPPKESEGARSGAARRERSARQAEKKAEDDGSDTLTAAGHRFRREGSAWVDVNYKPTMRSTGVRRGTEPFRALVADVPVVGRVAAAIDGEVIVVVRGHAYRIR
jgi:hypothetical protein